MREIPEVIEQAAGTALELTILMPCLNEAETLGACVHKAMGFLDRSGVPRRGARRRQRQHGRIAGHRRRGCGARVVPVPKRGYGAALIGGIAAARGRYVIMGDADDSYDFTRARCRSSTSCAKATTLVMGNRFLGGIAPGAMPPLHRYLGNPVLSGIGRLFFRSPGGDFHCGLRGFSPRGDADDWTCERPAWSSPARWSSRRRCTSCDRRGADDPVARRPHAPAASAQLARRVAPPALHAAVQPAVALPDSRPRSHASRDRRGHGRGTGARQGRPASCSTSTPSSTPRRP